MSKSRQPVSHAHFSTIPTSTRRLLAAPTFTFLASWRGQLLICTVVLVLGAVYFVVREPISTHRHLRREALSRARAEELMSMDSHTERDTVEEKGTKERVKRKDGKKRKVTSLRVPDGTSESSAAGPSSVDTSPASPSVREPLATTSSLSNEKSVPQDSSDFIRPQPRIHARRSTPLEPIVISSHSVRKHPVNALAPWEVPLPESPVAGPSRSSCVDSDNISVDADEASDSAHSSKPDLPKPNGIRTGFSIIPEEGYLPLLQVTAGAKKKKRRSKAQVQQSPLKASTSITSLNGEAAGGHPSTPDLGRSPAPETPRTPSSRHARKASLVRPAGADLENLIDERDRTIDSLRAEVGLAKAEEAKARDDAQRSKAVEEKTRTDLERVKRTNQRSETDGRRRESELQARLTQLSQAYNSTAQRLGSLESMLRESGNGLPPPSPVSLQHFQPNASPLQPTSPFGMPYASGVGRPLLPYPSPAMYPSPMLHPNGHSSSPNPFRRPSSADLAGALTPGNSVVTGAMPACTNGSHPFDIGSGIMPLGSAATRIPSPSGELSAMDLRRMSIESSVLKKKVQRKTDSDSGESSSLRASSESLLETDEGLEGLGIGDLGDNVSIIRLPNPNSTEGSTSSSSHPTSPSPQHRRQVIITPANADLFHRNGTHTPDSPATSSDLNGIKVGIDHERGNIYFQDVPEPRDENQKGEENDDEDDDELVERAGPVEPVFASLAHTPEQVREISRMRQQTMRVQRGRKRLSELGIGAPLTPSPSKSLASLRSI